MKDLITLGAECLNEWGGAQARQGNPYPQCNYEYHASRPPCSKPPKGVQARDGLRVTDGMVAKIRQADNQAGYVIEAYYVNGSQVDDVATALQVSARTIYKKLECINIAVGAAMTGAKLV